MKKFMKTATALVLMLALLFGSAAMALPERGIFSLKAGAVGGSAGSDLLWGVYDGVLEIWGTGAMYDYEPYRNGYNRSPWSAKTYDSIEIGEGVTSIGVRAFHDTKFSSITLPSTLEMIDEDAFIGAEGFDSVVIPSGVQKIKNAAFEYSSVKTVSLPSTLTYLGDSAFAYCDQLTSIVIPNSVPSIHTKVFDNCTNLKSVRISSGATFIDVEAFRSCTSLTSVTIPASVAKIYERAFYNCTSLKTVKLSKGLKEIWESAFQQTAVTSVTIPTTVTMIGEMAFGESKLTSITIPSSVTTLGDGAFAGCKLTSATINNGLKIISEGAFFNNPALTNVTIPVSVTKIRKSAFYNCKKLAKVYYAGTKAQYGKISIEKQNSSDTALAKATVYYGCKGPAKPASPAAKSYSYNAIKVSWKKVTNAAGYQVYYSTSKTGTYKCAGTVTSGSTLYFKHTKLSCGTTYYYKVRAYITKGGKKFYSGFTGIVSAKAIPGRVKPTAQKINTTSAKVSWDAVAGATGYQVYRSTSSSGTYTLIKTTTSLAYKDTGLKAKGTYYYKVRAYRTVSGNNVYGAATMVSVSLK